MISLKEQAIQYALDCKWQEAIEVNLSILNEVPDDMDTLNRLGFALMHIGEYERAKKTFEKVLALDESNPIATKNVKKLETLSKSGNNNTNGVPFNVKTFIEEAGKTKTVSLINLADKKTISNMQPGQEVTLIIKRSKIFILTKDGTYIGMLPHDLGLRLIEFLKEGNKYEAFLKGVEEKEVTVFIRECFRCKKFSNQPSFPSLQAGKKVRRRATI